MWLEQSGGLGQRGRKRERRGGLEPSVDSASHGGLQRRVASGCRGVLKTARHAERAGQDQVKGCCEDPSAGGGGTKQLDSRSILRTSP